MTHDDIIRMAREAGIEVHTRKGQIRIGSAVITGGDSTFEVLRFAELVAAHEREACALLCDEYGNRDGHGGIGFMCAEAIRARGEA